jgi:AcrR family transcriptional regulator
MTTVDRSARLASEQRLLREAADRLLAGTPQRSNGSLTIATLAAEAGLPRHRVYEHHADLIAKFKTTTLAGRPISADLQAVRQQLADAHQRIQQLEATQTQLTAKITTLCAVITELTHEAHADNVVALPRRHDMEPATPPQQLHRSLQDAQRRQKGDADGQHPTQGSSAPQRSVGGIGSAHPAQEGGDQRTNDPDCEDQSKGEHRHGR